MGWFLLFLFIYLNIGFALASFCWKRYGRYGQPEYFRLLDFFLWPISTLENIGRWESEGGNTPIISDFKDSGGEASYKAIVTALWPLKIIANAFLIAIALLVFALIIASRLIATIVVLAIGAAIFPARKFLKAEGLGKINLSGIWQKRLVIKEF